MVRINFFVFIFLLMTTLVNFGEISANNSVRAEGDTFFYLLFPSKFVYEEPSEFVIGVPARYVLDTNTGYYFLGKLIMNKDFQVTANLLSFSDEKILYLKSDLQKETLVKDEVLSIKMRIRELNEKNKKIILTNSKPKESFQKLKKECFVVPFFGNSNILLIKDSQLGEKLLSNQVNFVTKDQIKGGFYAPVPRGYK